MLYISSFRPYLKSSLMIPRWFHQKRQSNRHHKCRRTTHSRCNLLQTDSLLHHPHHHHHHHLLLLLLLLLIYSSHSSPTHRTTNRLSSLISHSCQMRTPCSRSRTTSRHPLHNPSVRSWFAILTFLPFHLLSPSLGSYLLLLPLAPLQAQPYL